MDVKLKARLLNEVIEVLRVIDDTAVIEFNASGAKSFMVDTQHAALAEIELPKNAFAKYNIKTDERLVFGMDKLKSGLLKLVQPKQIISINTDKYKGKNHYEFSAGNLNYITNSVEVYGSIKIKKPDLTTGQKAFAFVPTEELRQGCRAIESTSKLDYFIFEIDKKYFRMSGAVETNYVELKMPLASLEHRCQEPVKSLFGIEYFSPMAKAIPSEKTKIILSKDWPVELNFTFSKPDVKGTYILAPRIFN